MRRNQALEKARRVKAAERARLLDYLREHDVDAADLGDKAFQHRCRQLSNIPEGDFDAYLRQRASGRPFTSLRRLAALATLERLAESGGQMPRRRTVGPRDALSDLLGMLGEFGGDRERLVEAIQAERRRELMPPARRCRICGTAESRRWRWRVYCSQRCADAAWTAHRRAVRAKRRQRACVMCGALFSSRRADGKFCSSRCRQRAYRGRQVQSRWQEALEACSAVASTSRRRAGGEFSWRQERRHNTARHTAAP